MNQRILSWQKQKEQYEQRKSHYWKDMEIDQEFEPLVFDVTEQFVKDTIEVTGDNNPIYLDETSAKEASFPGRVAPQAAAMIFGRLAFLGEKYRPAPGGMIMGISFHFIKPVLVGDEITSQAKVIEKFEKKGKKFFKLRVESRNKNGELVSVMEQTGILPL